MTPEEIGKAIIETMDNDIYGLEYSDFDRHCAIALIAKFISAERDKAAKLKQALELRAKRSQYSWSDGPEYSGRDWHNEGMICCAELFLKEYGDV